MVGPIKTLWTISSMQSWKGDLHIFRVREINCYHPILEWLIVCAKMIDSLVMIDFGAFFHNYFSMCVTRKQRNDMMMWRRNMRTLYSLSVSYGLIMQCQIAIVMEHFNSGRYGAISDPFLSLFGVFNE